MFHYISEWNNSCRNANCSNKTAIKQRHFNWFIPEVYFCHKLNSGSSKYDISSNFNTISCNQISVWLHRRLLLVCGRAVNKDLNDRTPANVNNLLARNRHRYNRFVHSMQWYMFPESNHCYVCRRIDFNYITKYNYVNTFFTCFRIRLRFYCRFSGRSSVCPVIQVTLSYSIFC